MLFITDCGMVTALGLDMQTACAAYRTGITRPGSIAIGSLDLDTMEPKDQIGYTVPVVADGYQGESRLVILAVEALKNLGNSTGQSPDESEFWKDSVLMLCVSPTREGEDLTPDLDEERLKQMLTSHLNGAIASDDIQVIPLGNASMLSAALHLESSTYQWGVLLGVDSVIGPSELTYFQVDGRLKSPDSSRGLIPGEAAVALQVCSDESALEPHQDILAALDHIAVFDSESHIKDRERTDGKALSRVLKQVITSEPSYGDIYSDGNGEELKALELGSAIVIAFSSDHPVGNIHYPAESFGETGAASGGISICTAIHAIQRGYSQPGPSIICSTSDEGMLATGAVYPVR